MTLKRNNHQDNRVSVLDMTGRAEIGYVHLQPEAVDPTLIELEAGDGDSHVYLTLDMDEAQHLRDALSTLIGAAHIPSA